VEKAHDLLDAANKALYDYDTVRAAGGGILGSQTVVAEAGGRGRHRRRAGLGSRPGRRQGRLAVGATGRDGGGAAAPPVGAVPALAAVGARGARAAPASLFYIAFFAVPMLSRFVLSFWRAKGFELVPDFSLVNYQKIAGSHALSRHLAAHAGDRPGHRGHRRAGGLRARLPDALRLSPARRVILQLILISLFSGYMVRIYAWRTILGKQGLLNSTLGLAGPDRQAAGVPHLQQLRGGGDV